MISTKTKKVYYSSRANKHFFSKYTCAKSEAKFWIIDKYPSEQGCGMYCGCDYNEDHDHGYYAPHDLEKYDEIHKRLYKRILKRWIK